MNNKQGHARVEGREARGKEKPADANGGNPTTGSPGEAFSKYAAHGMVLVPLKPGEKRPRRKGWNQRENCITDPDAAGQLEAAGLAHAYSGTCAIDIDDLAVVRAKLTDCGIDIETLLNAPDAVRIERGDPNRTKLLYELPEPLTTLKPFPGLELRWARSKGSTLQDVLPPSLHPTGAHYRCVRQRSDRRLACAAAAP